MEELNIKELLAMMYQKKFMIILIMIVAIISGYIYTYNYTEPLYSSYATIILGKVSTTDGTFLDENITISESDLTLNSSLILTYSELAKSRSIMEEVQERLKNKVKADELLASVTVTRVNASDMLKVSAIHKDPVLSQKVVTEVVDVFSKHIQEIYKIDNVFIIDKPTVPNEPYNINHAKDIATYSFVGLFVSCAYILLCAFLDNTVKSPEDIESTLNVKTLITIPIDKKKNEELITVNDGKSVISESFRTLRTNVQFSSVDNKGPQVLLITSCFPSEGKSYVSANLAVTFAQTGKRVIIVDSDMRRGRQSKIFKVPIKNGLSNYISNIDSNGVEINWTLPEYIKRTKVPNLDIITAGSVPPNPAELLASTKIVELIETLKKYYDIIIFDGAPILPITDSLLLGRVIGRVMLVAVYNKTKKEDLAKAKAGIEDVGGKVIGIVLNKVMSGSGAYSDSYYYYSSEEKETGYIDHIRRIFDDKLEDVKEYFNNLGKKIKTSKRRLVAGKTPEQVAEETRRKQEAIKKKEEKALQKEIEAIKKEEERKIAAEEKARQDKIKAEEKAKQDAIRAEEKAKQDKIRAEEKAKQDAIRAEEKAKQDKLRAERKAELDKIREEERKKEEARLEEERKLQEEIRKEQARIKAEEDKVMLEEKAIRDRELEEKKAKLKAEREAKIQDFKIRAAQKKMQISEDLKVKKEEYSKKREEKKVKKEEQRRIALAERAIKEAEMIKARAEEKERREAQRIAQEEAKRVQAEEKAKQIAILAEEKAKREAEAKFTDEYLEENLYPKTKYNKF